MKVESLTQSHFVSDGITQHENCQVFNWELQVTRFGGSVDSSFMKMDNQDCSSSPLTFEGRHRHTLTCRHSTSAIRAGEFTRLSVRSKDHNSAVNPNLGFLLALSQIISVVLIFTDQNQFLPELSAALNLVRETRFPVDTTRTCRCQFQLSPSTCANNFDVTSF